MPARLVCDDAPHAAPTEGRRITLTQYQHAIAQIFGPAVAPSARYPGGHGASRTGYSTEPAISAIGAQGVEDLMLAAEDVAVEVAAALPGLLPCAATSPDEACAGRFIDRYGRRAYRRSLELAERQRLLDRFHEGRQSGASFTDAIALLTAYLLETPQFLYAMEDAAPSPRALRPEELASRLSFLLWDSIPDDALLDAAAAGPLSVTRELDRMLGAPAADATIARFFREWTGTTELKPGSKDLTTYPDLTDALAGSLNSSFDRFAQDQLKNGGTLSTLLTDPAAFVDAISAPFFGVPAPAAGRWEKAALDPTIYTGLATQPALLAALAHQQQGSFILRGKFVVERLLCQELGAPPPNAQSVFSGLPLPPSPTGKEVSASINANVGCAGCHTRLNPPGLAFERFDAVGHLIGSYPSGRAIDPSGALLLGAASIPFADQVELMRALAARPEIEACFQRQLFRFALSRPDSLTDGCALQAMRDASQASGGQLRAGLEALVSSDAFNFKVDL